MCRSSFFSYFITLSSQLWAKLLTIEKEKKGVLNDGQSVQLLRPDSDENRGAGNQQGFGAGPQQNPKAPKPKKGYAKKVALVVGAAVLFGAVGGVTMQGTSYLTGKLLGKNTKSTVGTTKTVSNAKLTTSTSTVTSDVSDIVENTLPSIVSITNMSVQEVQNFFGGISQQESESAGSGIIISQNDSELLVVTNNHVVEGSDTLTVTFNDGNSVEAQIKGTDSARDLAVVAVPLDKISDDTMNAIKVATLGDSDSLKVGEPAIAIGKQLVMDSLLQLVFVRCNRTNNCGLTENTSRQMQQSPCNVVELF